MQPAYLHLAQPCLRTRILNFCSCKKSLYKQKTKISRKFQCKTHKTLLTDAEGEYFTTLLNGTSFLSSLFNFLYLLFFASLRIFPLYQIQQRPDSNIDVNSSLEKQPENSGCRNSLVTAWIR